MRRLIGVLGVVLAAAAGCQKGRSSSTSPAPANGGPPGQSQPAIASVAPNQGPAAGGTTITVTGSGFQTSPSGARLLVGGIDATSVSVASTSRITGVTPAGSPGAVSVTVINPDGGTTALPSGFTYTGAPPTVTAVSPTQGPTTGGTGVTITGTSFTNGATVLFGTASASSVNVAGATTLTAFTPAGSAGTVSVTVTNPDGQSATLASAFTYVTASTGGVSISSITPNRGSVAGGTAVSLAGSGFASGANVTFGGSAATAVTVVGATAITCTTPSGSAGFVNVVVTNPSGGGSATAINGFEYRTPPSIMTVLPPTGSDAGGTRVVVYGSNFSTGATVTVGGASATNVSVNGAGTEIVCTTPAGTAGAADVVVTNSDGVGTTSTGAYTYVAAGTDPTIADVDPSAGLAGGGNTVTITGTGFVTGGTTRAWFGTQAGSNVVVQSATQLTVRPPAGTSGTRVHVHVANPGGLSVTALSAYGYDSAGTAPSFGGAASATSVSAYAVDLRWAAATDNVSLQPKLRYRIDFATTSGGQVFTAPPAFVTDPGATRYTVGGLTPSTTFYFVVRTVDEVGNEDSGTTERSAATRAWITRGTAVAILSADRALLTVSAPGDGRVLAAGGQSGTLANASSERYDPSTGAWAGSATTMAVGRESHVAAALADGRVLIAGGVQAGAGAISSAETYDSATDGWTPTGAMANGRYNTTATLLPSGKVLVAGGLTGTALTGGLLSQTNEVYDPTVGTWSVTGALNTIRHLHTATRLSDGRVLLVGGRNGNGTQSGTEAYTEASSSFSGTGALSRARQAHTATRLPSGLVLAVGGADLTNSPTGRLSSTELFNPGTNQWAVGPSLTTKRDDHSAVLLPNGWVLVAGGWDGSTQLSSVELYDPTASTWTAGPALAVAVTSQASILTRTGAVLTIGGVGQGTSNSHGSTAYKHVVGLTDVFAGAWHATAALPAARRRLAAVPLAAGRVLAAGGDASGVQASASLYDPATGTWTATTALGTARADHSLSLLTSGLVLAVGGTGASGPLATSELYDPAQGTWTSTGTLGTARADHGAALMPGGWVLVVGGNNAGALASAELYDPTKGTWTATGGLAAARVRHATTRLADGRVLVAGGDNSGALASCEVYVPSTGTWTVTGSLASARRGHAAVQLLNGRVMVTGGHNGTTTISGCEIWDPNTGTWTTTGSLNTVREDHRAVLLPSGRVVVAGGAGGVSATESWDPHTGTWATIGALGTGRSAPALVSLPGDRVLVLGGDSSGALASCEVFDEGLGYATGWRPRVDSVGGSKTFPVMLSLGATTAVTGLRLRGISEGHGGTMEDGGSDAPMVTLVGPLGGGGGEIEWRARGTALPAGTTLTLVAPPTGALPAGFYSLRVHANGIPSEARIVALP